MTQVIDATGFVADSFPADGVIREFDALWTGQDLPIEEPLAVRFDVSMRAEDLAPWFDKLGPGTGLVSSEGPDSSTDVNS